MRVDRSALDDAAARGILDPQQAEALWPFLAQRVNPAEAAAPRFRAAHLLYYLGGLIALGAATLFLNLGWERLGPDTGAAIAGGYAVACWYAASVLVGRYRLPLPAGLLGALVTACTPVFLYSVQQALGWWPADEWVYRDFHRWVDWHWWLMELGTLAVGAIVFHRFRLPFLTLPIAVTLWYMGMDLAALVTGGEADWELRQRFTLLFGLATVLVALWVDLRQRGPLDHAFWLYLFGLLGFWGALSSLDSHSELAALGYCAINLALVAAGAVLARRTFVVFGGLWRRRLPRPPGQGRVRRVAAVPARAHPDRARRASSPPASPGSATRTRSRSACGRCCRTRSPAPSSGGASDVQPPMLYTATCA
ncbi:MAG: DUF2157 domain-containing protein [Halofilum sp. (in: g-proteobacteria)]|nr:DUF2157 domain-containing protein [Halofilum sp. (in: g-proteobacteria)]